MSEAEFLEKKGSSQIKNLKRLFLVLVLLALGGLLTLAGFELIQFSKDLTKISGLGLLTLAIIYYMIY